MAAGPAVHAEDSRETTGAGSEPSRYVQTISAERESDYSPSAADPVPTWSAALEQQGQQRIRYAYDLASRGAIHTAQHELFRVLGTVAQTLDTDQGTPQHSEALASAQVALEEARDFLRATPQGGRPQGVAAIAATHRTPLLHQAEGNPVNPIVAMQRYYSYAGRQFATAAGGQPIAAEALFALGRVVSILRDHPVEREADAASMSEQKMLVFFQAAWAVDPRHHRAANEYGVLLARFNQWPQACQAFEYSVSHHPEAQNTQNLAVAYERLGERELAQQARLLGQSLAGEKQNSTAAAAESPAARVTPAVEWVDPATFAQTGGSAEWSSYSANDGPSNRPGELGALKSAPASEPPDSGAATNQPRTEKSRGLIPARRLGRWKSVFRSDRAENSRTE
ncbi:MAG: hypothetical protein AB7I48_17775 [Planctomycetaceae bacterium]